MFQSVVNVNMMDQIPSLISHLEEHGEHDTSLCHEFLATVLRDTNENPGEVSNYYAVIMLLGCKQYQSAYNILRWLGKGIM